MKQNQFFVQRFFNKTFPGSARSSAVLGPIVSCAVAVIVSACLSGDLHAQSSTAQPPAYTPPATDPLSHLRGGRPAPNQSNVGSNQLTPPWQRNHSAYPTRRTDMAPLNRQQRPANHQPPVARPPQAIFKTAQTAPPTTVNANTTPPVHQGLSTAAPPMPRPADHRFRETARQLNTSNSPPQATGSAAKPFFGQQPSFQNTQQVIQANFEAEAKKVVDGIDKATADLVDQASHTSASQTNDISGMFGDKASDLWESLEQENAGSWQDQLSGLLGGADIKRMAGSLAIVIGGYLGLVWLLRKINPRSNRAIPREVLEVVGSAPLDNRQNLQLVRLGSKLMLMIHGPDGTQPIGEITDPAEVEHLLSMCQGRKSSTPPAVSLAAQRQQASIASPSTPTLENQNSNMNQILSAIQNLGRNSHQYEA